jgi:hypothetical protein
MAEYRVWLHGAMGAGGGDRQTAVLGVLLGVLADC